MMDKDTAKALRDNWKGPSCTCGPCLDRRHLPPTLFYIKPGESYTHTCPSCKHMTILYGRPISYPTQSKD